MEQTIYNKEEYLYNNFHKLFRHSNININTTILQTNSTDKFGTNVGLINSLIKGTLQIEEPKKSIIPNLLQIFNSNVSDENIIKNNLENLIIEVSSIKKNADIVEKISQYLSTINLEDIIQQKIFIILNEILDNSNNVLFFNYNIITYNEYVIDKILEAVSLFTNTYTDQKKLFDKNIDILTNIFYKLKQTITFISFNKRPDKSLTTGEIGPRDEEQIDEESINNKNLKDNLLKTTTLIKDSEDLVKNAHKIESRVGNINYKLDYIKQCIRYKINLIKPKQAKIY